MEVGRELQRGQLGPPPNLNNIARRLQLELNRFVFPLFPFRSFCTDRVYVLTTDISEVSKSLF